MQLPRDISTCGATAGVFAQPRPQADMSRVEIPQCSGLPPRRNVLSFRSSTEGAAAAHLDSERFRTCPRTCRPPCGRMRCSRLVFCDMYARARVMGFFIILL